MFLAVSAYALGVIVMKHFSSVVTIRSVFFFFCVLSSFLLLLSPQPAIEAAREALRLCSETIIPSLFPFLVCSALLTSLTPLSSLEHILSPWMNRLFRLRGSSIIVLLLGFTGGYPVGVRTTVEFYQQGYLTREDAERLLAFCNNSGPGFLLGMVGIGVFHSTAIGLWLYVIHILSALLVGFLFRFYRSSSFNDDANRHFLPHTAEKNLPSLFTDAVTNSFFSLLNICAFVLFFMIFLRMLSYTGILHIVSLFISTVFSFLGLSEFLTTAFLAGIFELSTGAACMQGIPFSPLSAAVAAFLLGWGGFSVHCQSLMFLSDAGLSCKTYFTGKCLQGLFSAILAVCSFSLLA